jgi:hypothetical protein
MLPQAAWLCADGRLLPRRVAPGIWRPAAYRISCVDRFDHTEKVR